MSAGYSFFFLSKNENAEELDAKEAEIATVKGGGHRSSCRYYERLGGFGNDARTKRQATDTHLMQTREVGKEKQQKEHGKTAHYIERRTVTLHSSK